MNLNIRTQRGMTLVVALVMLVMLTLFAVTAMNTGTTNLKVVGNMQARSEAFGTAQQVVETVLSTPTFISNPANAIVNPCGAANTTCTDVNGDGVNDYTTVLSPQPSCVFIRPIKIVELSLSNPEDLGCAAGQAQQFGVTGSVSGDSLCANTVWEITAVTTSASSGARSAVTQGVGIRVSSDDTAATCI